MKPKLSAGASCLCLGRIWLKAYLPQKSLPFETHTEQKEWLHYAAREVKKMAGYAVKLSRFCCKGNNFSKDHSEMSWKFQITLIDWS